MTLPSLLQFLCLKNIRTFLKVCHDKFGLRNSDLFDPFDLFDVRDFGKVSGLFPGWPRPPWAEPRGQGQAGLCYNRRRRFRGWGCGTAPPAFSSCSE